MNNNTIESEMIFCRENEKYIVYECTMCGTFKSVPIDCDRPICDHK